MQVGNIIKTIIETVAHVRLERAKSMLLQKIKRTFSLLSHENTDTEQRAENNSTSSVQDQMADISADAHKVEACSDINERKLLTMETEHAQCCSRMLKVEKLESFVDQMDDENLRELLIDRIEEITEENRNFENQALIALSLMDEINGFIDSYSGNNHILLKQCGQALHNEFVANQCEILDSDIWEPGVQRATKIDYCLPAYSTTIIHKKLRCGLKIDGRLVRKQDVAIKKSQI